MLSPESSGAAAATRTPTLPAAATASPYDPIFIFSEVRLPNQQSRGATNCCFIPFCIDERTWSNAVNFPPCRPEDDMHVPLSGLVLHHRGRCQYHSGTSSVLGTSQSSWKWSKASFIDSHLKIRPIDEVARGGSIGHISDRGVSVSGSNAAGNGAPSLLQSSDRALACDPNVHRRRGQTACGSAH